MSERILLVEDEAAIARGLCDCLSYAGYEVEWLAEGRAGLAAALAQPFDLVLLDVMLPGINGFDICKQIRQQLPQQAVVMLTAKGAEADILQGFSCGADDYICKPFSVAQLLARIKAIFRRQAELAEPASENTFSEIENFSLGDIQIKVEHLQAQRGAESVSINRRDVEILHLFVDDPQRIVSRRRMLRDIWGFANPDAVETRSIDMHIVKLRKKLAQLTKNGGVETVRGEGYRWNLAN